MVLKNSDSHPIRIDSVRTPNGGVLGLTFCPGKKDLHSAAGPWSRSLSKDLADIAAWGARVMVTAIEDHEFDLLHVETLGRDARTWGMEWFHLPIRDAFPPDRRFENAWRSAGPRIHEVLTQGSKVLVHCRGGLGRAGVIAARVLVEEGMEPRTAMATVRAARPGSIETREQERYVLGLQPPVTQNC